VPDPQHRQTAAAWIGDFLDTDAFRGLAAPAKEYAEEILPAFLLRACDERGVGPADIEEPDLKPALLDGVGGLALPASVRAHAPDLCAAFLGELEAQGRLAGGRVLGRFVRALRAAYEERTTETTKPIRNPGARLGRNEPCPCGSGRKFKHCCMRR
jgi:hypothetical protein